MKRGLFWFTSAVALASCVRGGFEPTDEGPGVGDEAQAGDPGAASGDAATPLGDGVRTLLGGPCADDVDCADGLACSGDQCLRVDGEICGTDFVCVNRCVVDTCGPPSGRGGPCDETEDCATGHQCVDDRCVGLDGEACALTTECVNACVAEICGPAQYFVYTVSDANAAIDVQQLDLATGALVPVQSTTNGQGIPITAAEATPDSRYLYTVNDDEAGGGNSVSGFTINSDGTLTPHTSFPMIFADWAYLKDIKIDHTGLHAYLSIGEEGDGPEVVLFHVGADGSLTESGTVIPSGDGVISCVSIAIHPDNDRVYVTGAWDDEAVSGYARDPATGLLTHLPGSPYATGVRPADPSVKVIFDASGRRFYHGAEENFGAEIAGLAIDPTTGALSPLSGSPFGHSGGLTVSSLAAHSGGFVYGASGDTNENLLLFYLDPIGGGLTESPLSPYEVADYRPEGLVVDPTEQYLIVPLRNASVLHVFAINSATGALTEVAGSPFPTVTEPWYTIVVAVP